MIAVPGDGGSQLEAKLNKPSKVAWYCKKKTDYWFDLWLNIESLLPKAIDCLVDNMRYVCWVLFWSCGILYIALDEALDDHEGSFSIGGRLITNFRFADDTVVNSEEEEAGVLVDRLDITTTRYKIKIGPDKTKVMINNQNGFQREINVKGQRLEEVEKFKYIGTIIPDEGSKPEILSRIAQTTASLSRLKIIWRDKNISLSLCGRLSYPPSFMPESWTLTAEIESLR